MYKSIPNKLAEAYAQYLEDGVVEFFFRDRTTEGLEWFESKTILEGFNEGIEHYLNLMARYGN